MYLFNSLDKSNPGNAKTAGFDIDVGIKGNQYTANQYTVNQYTVMLSVFLVS